MVPEILRVSEPLVTSSTALLIVSPFTKAVNVQVVAGLSVNVMR